ncbi:hypothetical protein [Chitinophaga sp. RAB17]|uniref:hypothetical protein n=1 Tax=Chitinophaga sp. RAB17 TaxID=3233049 RepID=UPI003F91F1AB
MKTIKTILLSVAVIATILFSACGDSAPSKNYFSEAGLTLETFSNQELNNHLKKMEPLYNEMAFAVEKKDKGADARLSASFSDWLLQALSFKDSLPIEEQKKFDDVLEKINSKWVEKKNKLL